MGGYLGISTKGHAQRKLNPTQSLDFVVQNDTILDVSATVFLSNPNNKQGFICLLSDKINAKTRLTAKKYSGDADRFMVTTALEGFPTFLPTAFLTTAPPSRTLTLTLTQTLTLTLTLTMTIALTMTVLTFWLEMRWSEMKWADKGVTPLRHWNSTNPYF